MSETTPNAEPTPASLAQAALIPVPRRSKHSVTFQTRMWCLFMIVICGGMLAIGLYMRPSPKGYGTHSENLFLPPCGFLQVTRIPCPTCGCTTAVTHIAHGNLWMGIKTQPFGAAVGILAATLLVLSLFGLVTGRWIGPQPFTLGWYWRPIAFGSIGFLLFGWVYKIIAMKNGW